MKRRWVPPAPPLSILFNTCGVFSKKEGKKREVKWSPALSLIPPGEKKEDLSLAGVWRVSAPGPPGCSKWWAGKKKGKGEGGGGGGEHASCAGKKSAVKSRRVIVVNPALPKGGEKGKEKGEKTFVLNPNLFVNCRCDGRHDEKNEKRKKGEGSSSLYELRVLCCRSVSTAPFGGKEKKWHLTLYGPNSSTAGSRGRAGKRGGEDKRGKREKKARANWERSAPLPA